jgi:hypothetical protein
MSRSVATSRGLSHPALRPTYQRRLLRDHRDQLPHDLQCVSRLSLDFSSPGSDGSWSARVPLGPLVRICSVIGVTRPKIADVDDNDRNAIIVAAACFVHCVAAPLLLSFAGFSSLIGLSEKLEPAFFLTSILLGAATLVPAYRKTHGRISCLAMFAGGLSCLIIRSFQCAPLVETLSVGAGATLIIGAHALNLRFSRRCACCQPSAVVESEERRL